MGETDGFRWLSVAREHADECGWVIINAPVLVDVVSQQILAVGEWEIAHRLMMFETLPEEDGPDLKPRERVKSARNHRRAK